MCEEWRYTAIAITKYNPIYRDKNGVYERDEWTSIVDLGQIYNGEEFQMEEYLRVEGLYISVIRKLLEVFQCRKILVRDFELFDNESLYSIVGDSLLHQINQNNTEFELIAENLDEIMKIALRECAFLELVIGNRKQAVVRFGYDYYMYINTDVDIGHVNKYAEQLGLFVGR